MKINVCAVFDVGKTNKKVFLFDETYEIVWEKSESFEEVSDDDGDPCENLSLLNEWTIASYNEIRNLGEYNIKAVNFSAYGASFVHLDEFGRPLTPLYNYLKPFPENLLNEFYETYGGKTEFAITSASPVLGNLNSGMQLYRLSKENTKVFNKIKYSLHLPQYLSFLLTGEYYSDMTSVGCHTNLWDFTKMKYHRWTTYEKVETKLAPLHYSEYPIKLENGIYAGIGLHDSSSAIIPYLINFSEPFVLISTGTWCISLNPFNTTELTFEELQNDCLCYLHYKEKPVKASRLFAGNEHEIETKRLAEHFGVSTDSYKKVDFNSKIIQLLKEKPVEIEKHEILKESQFKNRDISNFNSYEEAYHQFIMDIVAQQIVSTALVVYNCPVKKIFIDGGFSKNPIYMNLMAEAFPEIEVYAASVAQASALGAAVTIHPFWNTKPLSNNLITLKKYSSNINVRNI